MDKLEITEENSCLVKTLLVNGLGDQWKMFARLLKVTDNEIATAEQENKNNVSEQIYAVIESRFGRYPDTNWNDLKKVLIILKKNELIEEIENFFSNDENGKEIDSTRLSLLHNIISSYIVSDWKEIVRKLGLPEEEIDVIRENHSNDVKEQAYQALRRLKEMKKKLEWVNIKPFIKSTVAGDIEREMQEYGLLSPQYFKLHKFENCSHSVEFSMHGFGIVAHLTNDKIKLLEKSFNNFDPLSNFTENILVYRGGNKKAVLSPQEWLKEGRDYYQRFFQEEDYLIFYGKNEGLLFTGFENYLRKTKSAFLIQGYNLFEHYQLLDAVASIPVKEAHRINFQKQFIAYEATNNVLYFIHVSESKDLDELEDTIEECTASIQMFILLHKDMVKNSGISLVSIIVTDGSFMHDEISLLCEDCGTFVMSCEKFKNFDIATEQSVGKVVYKNTAKIRQNSNIKNYEYWKYDIGNILTFLAMEDSDLLPSLTDEVAAQVDEAQKVLLSSGKSGINIGKILLSPQQIAIKNSKEQHILLQGSHGSGKSVVGRFCLKKIAKNQPASDIT